MIKSFASILILAVISLTLIAVPVLASTITGAEFKGDVTITNTSTAATNVSVPFTLSTANFITDGYINSACTNTSIQIGGADTAYMPGHGANPWVVFTPSIALNGNIISKLYTGGPAMNGKIRYFPDTAGMTTNDAAALELGNNFEVELSGYLTANGVLFDKSLAFRIATFNNGLSTDKVGGFIFEGTSGNYLAYSNGTGYYKFSPTVTRRGMRINGIGPVLITAADVYLSKSGSPTGTVYLNVRNVADDTLIGTLGSIEASSLADGEAIKTFNTNPIYAENATDIRVMVEHAESTVTNYVRVSYAGGAGSSTRTVYDTGSYSDTASVGGIIRITRSLLLKGATSSYSPSESIVKVTADGTNLKLYTGGVERDSVALAGATVPNNANNYVCFANYSMPYVDYLKITVGGTLQQHIAWQYAATLTDQSGQGNNPASVSFRTTSSDADVSAALTTFVPASVSSSTVTPGTSVEFITTPDLPVISDFPQMYTEGETGGFVIDDMYNPHLAAVGIPQAVFWYPIAFLIAIIAGFGAFLLTKELIVQAVVSAVVMAGFCGGGVLGDGLIPYWTVIVFIFEAGMLILIKEHQRI